MSVRASIVVLLLPLFYAHAEPLYYGVYRDQRESSRACGGNRPYYSADDHVKCIEAARRSMRTAATRLLDERLTEALPASAQILYRKLALVHPEGPPHWSFHEVRNQFGDHPRVEHVERQTYQLEVLALAKEHSQATPRRLTGIYLQLSGDGVHSEFELVREATELRVSNAGRLRVRLSRADAARVNAVIAQGGIEYARLHLKNEHGVATAGELFKVEELTDFLGLSPLTRLKMFVRGCGEKLSTLAGN